MAKELKFQNRTRIAHPDNDGTYVEFYNMSPRQLDVLKAYKNQAEDESFDIQAQAIKQNQQNDNRNKRKNRIG